MHSATWAAPMTLPGVLAALISFVCWCRTSELIEHGQPSGAPADSFPGNPERRLRRVHWPPQQYLTRRDGGEPLARRGASGGGHFVGGSAAAGGSCSWAACGLLHPGLGSGEPGVLRSCLYPGWWCLAVS